MPQVSEEAASQIAVAHVRRQKGTPNVDVATVEKKGTGWVVRGTCPIDLEGHSWAEKFAVSVDEKGKVKAANFALL